MSMVTRSHIHHPDAGRQGADLAAVVFVSPSAEDARVFRAMIDTGRWLVVNVPDLTGARAVIGKLLPEFVVCDTELEGEGSWLDLLRGRDSHLSFVLVVMSQHADGDLRAEVLSLGGFDLLRKLFIVDDVERVTCLALEESRQRRAALAYASVLHCARWIETGSQGPRPKHDSKSDAKPPPEEGQ
jgi:DNA-binding NtrC family response regulator